MTRKLKKCFINKDLRPKIEGMYVQPLALRAKQSTLKERNSKLTPQKIVESSIAKVG